MNIEEEIGNRIRELRNRSGLTQEELANRTELTKGFISQLERGHTAPSLMTLADIVECLGVSMSDFFKYDDVQPVLYPKDNYFEKVDEQGNRTQWLIANAQGMSMEPILVSIMPGESLPVDKPHEGEEFGYVLSGSVEVHYGEQAFHAECGDSFMYHADRNHWLSTTEETGAKVLWISCPPYF